MSDHATEFLRAAELVQARKHEAYIETSRAASDADWDSETYWRARAEGLADAERLLRSAAAVLPSREKKPQ